MTMEDLGFKVGLDRVEPEEPLLLLEPLLLPRVLVLVVVLVVVVGLITGCATGEMDGRRVICWMIWGW